MHIHLSLRRRLSAAALALTAISLLASACSASGTSASGSGSLTSASGHKPFIALSNGFIGNGWRQTMVADFQTAAQKAKAQGLISRYTVVNAPGQNSATEQIGQIKSLLLQRPDALLIDPASTTALIPVINQACAAHIVVIVFDSAISDPCAHVLQNSFVDWATDAAKPLLTYIHGQGNVIISRGVVGSQPEAQMYATTQRILRGYPGVKVAATVTGMGSAATAQTAVLGVLGSVPQVKAVIGVGDGYGVAQAFATANRPAPAVTFGTDGRSLAYWKNRMADSGSVAVMSDPGQSIAALWEALAVLGGKKVPQHMTFPIIVITAQTRDAWLKFLTPDEYASWQWTPALFSKEVQAIQHGQPLVTPPVPTAGS